MLPSNNAKFPDQLWWGKREQKGRTMSPPLDPTTSRPDRNVDNEPPNIYWTQQDGQHYRAGGLITGDGVVDRDRLHRLMKLVALRLEEASGEEQAKRENDQLPSGYTYLMQFIAHDMVDTVMSMQRMGSNHSKVRSARQSALTLETLYGSGPDELPSAYSVSDVDIRARGAIPRTYLRVGQRQAPSATAGATSYCPYRDLTRLRAPESDELTGDENRAFWTDVCIADTRNDQHAFMSQLTVLFQLLHNHVVGLLEGVPETTSPLEDAQRRYLAARAVVTLIYRNIIVKDVLPKIVEKRVLDRYKNLTTSLFGGQDAVPLEFTHGAFRFGHALVRDKYNVRSDTVAEETMIALDFNSLRMPAFLPVPEKWFVDWARFFHTSAPTSPDFRRNFAMRIGPHYPRALTTSITFPPRTDLDVNGLANRDLLSAAYAGLLSVPAMTAKFGTVFRDIPELAYDQWRNSLKDFLMMTGRTGVPFTEEDISSLLDDPPLPLYVLFEAEVVASGRRLGPLGSIIVAEAIYGAMLAHPTGFESPSSTLRGRIATAARAYYEGQGDAAVTILSAIGEIETMPQLLDFLKDANEFPNVPA